MANFDAHLRITSHQQTTPILRHFPLNECHFKRYVTLVTVFKLTNCLIDLLFPFIIRCLIQSYLQRDAIKDAHFLTLIRDHPMGINIKFRVPSLLIPISARETIVYSVFQN